MMMMIMILHDDEYFDENNKKPGIIIGDEIFLSIISNWEIWISPT